jgi:spore coat protein U-like protein
MAMLLAGVSPARAQFGPHDQDGDLNCSFSMSGISFGTVDLSTGRQADAVGNFTYACTGASRQMVRICPSWDIGSPGYLQDGAGHRLVFGLFSDESHASVWGTWFARNQGFTIDVPMGRSERTMGSAPVYAAIPGGQTGVPPGTYRATIGGGHVSIAYANASNGSCDSIKHNYNVSRVSFTVSAVVTGPAVPMAPVGGAAGPASGQLARGMTMEALYGQGKQISESVGDAGLKTEVYEYVTSDRHVEVTYVDRLVVRYSITSK